MGHGARLRACVSGDDVKGRLHVFAPHVVVVLQDWRDALLVLGQLLNSQCVNRAIHLVPNDSASSKQVKFYGINSQWEEKTAGHKRGIESSTPHNWKIKQLDERS